MVEGHNEDWILLIEHPNPGIIKNLIDIIEGHDFEFFYEKENKEIWEPYPHSTEKLYIKENQLDDTKEILIMEDVIEETNID